MIIRGGENIYPRELEELIYLHPSVLDVQVVGVPDAKFGEEVVACVKLRPGEPEDADAIIAFCRGRVAHYKVPRYVCFMDSFPMTVSGKVQKFQLREMMEAELAKADG
jgi:fatty-acyl-CoA synthase